MPTRELLSADLAIPIAYTADTKTRQLTVKAELANPINREEREQLLKSMSFLYGFNNASLEINMTRTSLEIRGNYQW